MAAGHRVEILFAIAAFVGQVRQEIECNAGIQAWDLAMVRRSTRVGDGIAEIWAYHVLIRSIYLSLGKCVVSVVNEQPGTIGILRILSQLIVEYLLDVL